MSAEQLLKLHLLLDAAEIEAEGDDSFFLLETYDCKGQTPKRLTTRMVRAWRDKPIRYVAQEFAWLSPDR